MIEMPDNGDFLFASVCVTKIVLAGDNFHAFASTLEAMSRAEDPTLIDDCSAAKMSISLDADLPGERASFSVVSTNNVAIRVCVGGEMVTKESLATFNILSGTTSKSNFN